MEELITWDARVLKLASTSSEEDAQRHVRSFFKGMQKALVFQVTLEEGNEELSRMMQHLMRMVANARRDNRHPSKWVIFVAHIVKSSRALRLPLHPDFTTKTGLSRVFSWGCSMVVASPKASRHFKAKVNDES